MLLHHLMPFFVCNAAATPGLEVHVQCLNFIIASVVCYKSFVLHLWSLMHVAALTYTTADTRFLVVKIQRKQQNHKLSVRNSLSQRQQEGTCSHAWQLLVGQHPDITAGKPCSLQERLLTVCEVLENTTSGIEKLVSIDSGIALAGLVQTVTVSGVQDQCTARTRRF